MQRSDLPRHSLTIAIALGLLALAVSLIPLSSAAVLAQTAEPTVQSTSTALPQPTRTANALEGTVAAVSAQASTITLNTAQGGLQTYQIPEGVSVVRNSQPSSLAEVQATDRVIIQRDPAGTILSVLAFAVPPTPSPTQLPTVQTSPTAGPAATGTATVPTPAGTPGPRIYSGTVVQVAEGLLTISGDDGTEQQVVTANVPELQVTRDGEATSAEAIAVGDTVEVTYNASNVPTVIAAQSTENSAPPAATGVGLRWLAYLLPMLALLLVPLLLILTGKQPGRSFVVMRRRS